MGPLWLNNSSNSSGISWDPAKSWEVAVERRQSREEMNDKAGDPPGGVGDDGGKEGVAEGRLQVDGACGGDREREKGSGF